MSDEKSSNQELYTNAKQAELYAKFRPQYPDKVFEKICSYCKEQGGRFDLAIDVGCGSGQSTLPLTKHFKQVIGIDVSKEQIANAPKAIANLSFQVSPAEDLGFVEDESVDLVTVAQAFHWMDQCKFFEEVTRVLKPGGCLAVYGYSFCQLSHPEANEYLNHVVTQVLSPYFGEEAKQLNEHKYSTVTLPYPGWKREDDLEIEMECSVQDFVGYMESRASVQLLEADNPNTSFLQDFETKLQTFLHHGDENVDENAKLEVIWPAFLLIGSKPKRT